MKQKLIKFIQRYIDKKYEKHGLTDEILKQQIKLNQLKYKHNIIDPNEVVYDNYVQ